MKFTEAIKVGDLYVIPSEPFYKKMVLKVTACDETGITMIDVLLPKRGDDFSVKHCWIPSPAQWYFDEGKFVPYSSDKASPATPGGIVATHLPITRKRRSGTK